MKVIVSPRAEKQLRKLPKVKQIIMARKIRSVGLGDQVANEEKLKGYTDIFRTRVGDYRIVYKRGKHEVYIILIGHRREIYELLERLTNK